MPVKKSKKPKGKKQKGRRVATAPTRDVIINISTARPRARREPALRTAPTPKRNEDLGGRIRENEIIQGQFRATELIKEQAKQIGLIDKRLSVLTDVIDNERNKPLFQEINKKEEERLYELVKQAEQVEKERLAKKLSGGGGGGGVQQREEEEERGAEEQPRSKSRGRPRLTEEQKRLNKEKRNKDKQEQFVFGTPVGEEGGGVVIEPYAESVGASKKKIIKSRGETKG